MNYSEFFLFYILSGAIISMLIMLFPESYVSNLRYAVIVLKTASLKMQNKQNKKPSEEVKKAQIQYTQEFDKQIQSDAEEIQSSPTKYNITLFKMLFFWPMILFVFFMAFLLKILYLEDKDMP
jgi:hypothetical protein